MTYLLSPSDPGEAARFIRDRLPAGGLFAGHTWRVSPTPFPLGPDLAEELRGLGRVLLAFYQAANRLYLESVASRQPAWIAQWLDQGKPAELVALQRSPGFKSALPRVIRPDLLLTEAGWTLVELDGVPGGIGLTAWLNQTYSAWSAAHPPDSTGLAPPPVIGGADGMLQGFSGIFGNAPRVHVVVSEEAATYRPEMDWLCCELNDIEGAAGPGRFWVRNTQSQDIAPGDAVYRFFELFDLPQVPNASWLFHQALERRITLTPPPKPIFEEKLLLALLWNRNLREFWRRELGEGFFDRLRQHVPYTWVLDPAPLPPHAALPELNLTDWRQLAGLSQRDRQLVIKVSGFSPLAWGARGVWLGSDLAKAEWAAVVDRALAGFAQNPCVLQRYHQPRRIETAWYDFDHERLTPLAGRARLCPYYFLTGQGDAARAHWGGVLATVCPLDKKIIHGMSEAILMPCTA